MGQEEVLEILRKKKIATTKEILEELDVNETSVRNALNRMINKEVEKLLIRVKGVRICYAWKIKGYKIQKSFLEKYPTLKLIKENGKEI
jgi:Mn-dependent DtxR family transcriptional regulator